MLTADPQQLLQASRKVGRVASGALLVLPADPLQALFYRGLLVSAEPAIGEAIKAEPAVHRPVPVILFGPFILQRGHGCAFKVDLP